MFYYNYFDFIIESNIQLTNFEARNCPHSISQTPIKINYQHCDPLTVHKNNYDAYISYEDVVFHIPKEGGIINILSNDLECFQEVLRNKPFSIVCFLQGRTVLHASSIETDRGIYAFCGPTGMGKTTISLLLAKKYPLFSDDQLCIEKSIDGKLMCYSPDNVQKITHSTLKYLQLDEKSKYLHPVYKKYMYHSPNFTSNVQNALNAIFILKRMGEDANIFIKKITDNSHKTAQIINNTLARKQLLSMGYAKSDIVKSLLNVDMFYLYYPSFFEKNIDFINEFEMITRSI